MEKTIKGRNHEGLERTYTFKLMSPMQGVMLVHNYAGVAGMAYQHFKSLFQKMADSVEDLEAGKEPAGNGEVGFIDLISMVPQILTADKMEQLAKIMMAGGKVDNHQLDDAGFCDLFGDDFVEFYFALFYAIVANYPRYVLPFSDMVQDALTPDSEETKEVETS
jgi:hypothetical protein